MSAADPLAPLLAALSDAANRGPGERAATALAVVVAVVDIDPDEEVLTARQVEVRFEGEETPSTRYILAPPGMASYLAAGDRVVLLAVGRTWVVVGALDSQSSPPFGTVVVSATPADPVGYVKCNGQTVSRDVFPRLFEALGERFGAGDGATTFVLPRMTHPNPPLLHYVIKAR